MICKDLSNASVWFFFFLFFVQEDIRTFWSTSKVIQSFIFHSHCSVDFGSGEETRWLSPAAVFLVSLEWTAFSTGQDGAMRSVGEELKTTSGLPYYWSCLSIKSSCHFLVTFYFWVLPFHWNWVPLQTLNVEKWSSKSCDIYYLNC